ncbi:uncharacterized protein LW93_2907 [Fusarium fujikuroi]|nr:uncharacterized protein LW93_2907 [Fusarium fujikuroi]
MAGQAWGALLDVICNVRFILNTVRLAAVLEARLNKIAYALAGRKLGMGREFDCPPLEALTLGPQLGHPGQQVLNGLWATVLMAFDSSNSSTDRRDLQSLAELLRLRNQVHSEHSEAEETDSNVTDNTCIEILLNMTYYIDSSGGVTPKEEDIDTQFRLTFAPNRFQYLPQSDFRARRSEHAIVLSTELSL